MTASAIFGYRTVGLNGSNRREETMTKWADYCVSKVGYSDQHSRIIKVLVHKDLGETIGRGEEWTRDQAISAIDDGYRVITIIKKEKWHKGQDVQIVKKGGTKFIRTTKDQIAADNLENLPEF